ncbi:MAG: LuxR C-terminal-related transcriptional regulator [Methylorubrum populi]
MHAETGTLTEAPCAEAGSALVPLLRARFEPPAYGFVPVETRMLRSFRSGPLTKVTIAVAPTGFGKTVLMTQLHALLAGRGERCIWVGLDDRRIDLPLLLGHIEAALRLGGPHPALPIMVDPRGDAQARIDRVVQALEAAPGDTTLFLDNLNSCEDADLTLLMDALVFRTPRNVRVVASSTRPIAFDIGRARVEMKLRRLTPMELGFDHSDTEAVLRAAGLQDVPPETVAAIVGRTEGWPAAVRLVQLILEGEAREARAIESFTGADSDFAALLSRRLMGTFDPELVAFLHDIAVLRVFSADLARKATGNPDAAGWIRYLVERNVLIVPLDRERTWFRFHALFREFLQAESERRDPARQREVAVRAAAWLGEHGEYGHALDLALSAGDASLVASLLDATAQPMVRDRGELSGFVELVHRAASCRAEPGLDALFWYAWAQAFTRDYGGARATLRRLDERIPLERPAETVTGPLRQRQRAAEIVVSYHLNDLRAVRDGAPIWLAASESQPPFDRAAVAAALALAALTDSDFGRARQALREMDSAIIRTRSDYGRVWACLVAATVDVAQGDAAGAERQLRAIDPDLRARLGGETGIASVLILMEARVAADLGKTADALEPIRAWLPRGVENGILEIAWLAMDAAVDALFTDAAPFSLEVLEAFAARFGPRLSFLLEAAAIRRMLRAGCFEAAQERLGRTGLIDRDGQPVATLPVSLTATEASAARLAQIEFCASAGKWRQAEGLAAEALQDAVREGRRREQVDLHLTLASLALRSANAPAARTAFAKAVTLAARAALMRPFLQREGLVHDLIATTPMKKLGLIQAIDLAFFQSVCAAVRASPAGAEADGSLSFDAVTPREVELLRLLDAGYDNARIAAELSLSLPTVKWHLSNIYSKLGVSRRSAALVRARALRLLA